MNTENGRTHSTTASKSGICRVGALALALTMPATSLLADNVVWTNTTAATANWTGVGNWVLDDSLKTPAGSYPSGTDYSVTFLPPTLWQKVTLPNPGSNGATFSIGAISGGSVFERLQAPDWIGGGPSTRNYAFGDVSDYLGSLNFSCTYGVLKFTGANTDVRLADLGIAYRSELNVPAGVSLTCDSLHQGGAITKTGTGSLMVKASSVPDSTILYHRGGTLSLEGVSESAGHMPAGEPAYWFDASRTNLMTLAPDGDSGRDYITRWRDCRYDMDGTRYKTYAYPRGNQEKYTPWISTNRLNGLSLVDFGDNEKGTAVTEKGFSAAVSFGNMPFGESAACSQEVFIVAITRPGGNSGLCHLIDNNTSTYYISSDLSYGGSKAESKNGLRRYDGRDAAYNSKTTIGRPHILDIAPAGKINPPCDMGWVRNFNYKGGFMMAEAIVYSNVLSHAERAQTTRYLQRKWFGCEGDVEVLSTLNNTCKVNVPDGNVARVIEGVVNGTALAKSGGGTLKVGRFRDRAPAVEIEGGAVAFDETYAPANDDAPAADPIFWGDATTDSFVFASGSDTDVARWNDCRPGQTTYYATSKVTGVYPTISADTCNGKRLLDFGSDSSTAAWMEINCGEKILEVFALERRLGGAMSLFGGGFWSLYGGTTTILNNMACKQANAALWTVNGKTYDPKATPFTYDTTDYVVASASCETTEAWFQRLVYNGNIQKGGYFRIGEFIAYDRHLSDRERRQTVAYLMRKWRNETYDFAAPQDAAFGSMTFKAGNATAKFVADVDTAIGNLAMNGQTDVVKTGTGSVVCASSTLPASLGSVSLEGTLDFGPGAEVAVASLVGRGTLGADAVTGVSSVAVTVGSGWDVAAKRVTGTLSFASSLSVAFAVDDPAAAEDGLYPLLSADGGVLAAPGSIAVTGLEGLPGGKSARVRVAPGGLALSVSPKGTTILLR